MQSGSFRRSAGLSGSLPSTTRRYARRAVRTGAARLGYVTGSATDWKGNQVLTQTSMPMTSTPFRERPVLPFLLYG